LAIQMFLEPGEGRERVSRVNQKRVVIISSIAGQRATLLAPMYVASKHAM
jgi:NAD(P)-dependent dehydrogenase (short-subunit alcohol dehydrogenase family)